ncbi:MAG: formylglycine-generating enzyme family protein [Rhodospirillales bacterium]|nr:formylglycine-generating enzyme family protein [Rhodospirillales bacterium]
MPLKSILFPFAFLAVAGFWVAGTVPSLSQAPLGDIVTTRGGDFHHGAVAQEYITIETAYGKVTVPHGRLARLVTADPRRGREDDRIVTVEGERFSGRIETRKLFVIRLLDVPLNVHLDDVAGIEFARKGTKPETRGSPDVVEMRNGDIFRGRILTTDLLFKTDDGIRMVPFKDVYVVDVGASEDGGVRAMGTGNDGGATSGMLMTESLQMETRVGQTLSIPVAEIEGIGVSVLPPHRPLPGELSFVFRGHLPTSAVLRDVMANGLPGPEVVVIRAASFQRGDLGGDGDGDEKPPQTVTLSQPYAIGLYEVTFDEYDLFCDSTGREKPDDAGWGRGRRPVINVSWEDAVAYTKWMSEQTAHHYRLPTDAEWEYAARGSSKTRFWWGNSVGRGNANCAGCVSVWGGERTAPVGRFPGNPFGLHDTAGNVFEWVADCYTDVFAEGPSDGSAVEKPGCGKRVIRGGSWSFPPKEVRSANRWRDFPTRQSDDTGFRILREME